MSYVHLENARSEDQMAVLEKIERDAVCPFCTENLPTYHKNPILNEGAYWILTTNQWPYKHTKRHLLAISKTHVENFSELDPAAGAELFKLFAQAAETMGIDGGGIGIRFGQLTKPASSVRHLHAHLIEPDTENPGHQDVSFKISKN